MNEFKETVERITNTIEAVLKNCVCSPGRCLSTSALVREFLERAGFDAEIWTGSTDYISRKGVRLIEENLLDIEDGENTPERVRTLRRHKPQGLRIISCRANERPQATDLGGHVCVVAGKEGRWLFIDPTSGQFARDDRGKGGKHEVVVPPKFITEIASPAAAKRIVHHIKRRTYGLYRAGAIDALSAPRFEDPDGYHDLNPRRLAHVYDAIGGALVSLVDLHSRVA